MLYYLLRSSRVWQKRASEGHATAGPYSCICISERGKDQDTYIAKVAVGVAQVSQPSQQVLVLSRLRVS